MAPSHRTWIPADLPREPLDIQTNGRGFLPPIGLHARGRADVQESSFSHFGFFAVMLATAGALALSPWDARTATGAWSMKYLIAGGLAWAGLCGFAPYWVRNAFGQTILVDPAKRTRTIRRGATGRVVPWNALLGLQICRHASSPTLSCFAAENGGFAVLRLPIRGGAWQNPAPS